MDCWHCGQETPEDGFCTWCGAPLGPESDAHGRMRHHRFSANPGEHVSQPSVVTTLFPHLPGHRVHEFRWGLIGGAAAIVILIVAGLIVPAILTATVLVPVLYLIYLYEAQVYRDEPVQVIGLTMVAGAAIGWATMVVADHLISSPPPLNIPERTGVLVAATILLPLISEVLKPIPVFVLRRVASFPETIDGLAFGVAAGLGFAGAQTVVNFSRIIAYEPIRAHSSSWVFPVIGIAVLTPLLQASCTGALVASLWRPGARPASWLYAVGAPIAIVSHIAYSWVSLLLVDHGVNQFGVLVWQGAVVAAVLVYIRFLVHRALLDEAADLGFQPVVCPHCRRHVEAAAFCPHCGAAISAGPRTGPSSGLMSERPSGPPSDAGSPGAPPAPGAESGSAPSPD
jgi:RsiW-degrading membrane proteinase PrsW (M82 family)